MVSNTSAHSAETSPSNLDGKSCEVFVEKKKKKLINHKVKFYPFSPVRPTFLRHIKQRFFLGLGGSGALNSSLPAVEGWEGENVG